VGTRVALVLADDVGREAVGPDLRALVRGLVLRGVDVEVVCAARTGAAFDATGARVTALTVGVGVGAVTALRKVLRESGVDVIHAYGLRAGLAASLARTGLPLVVDWPGPVPAAGAAGLARRALARTVSAAADLTLAASTDLVATADRLGAREVVLAPVIAPELGPPQRPVDEVREDLGVTGPMVLGVGRLHADTRFDVLVAASARWRYRQPGPQVVLAGTGPAYRDLAKQAVTSRAPVIFAGERDDIADLLGAADIAVVTAERERPTFALEAARAGVALVATASGGLADLLGTGSALVPAGDVDALDDAVRRLLDDPPGRAVLAAAGRAQAATWPPVDEAVGEIAAAYARLIDAASAAAADGAAAAASAAAAAASAGPEGAASAAEAAGDTPEGGR
jgi:glycosyltransferase involved in cell wall biosynthesis